MPSREQCKITVNGEKELSVQKGQVLLTSLWRENILVPSVCGGRGICGACKVRVSRGLEGIALTAAEQKLLKAEERNSQFHLACQVRVENSLAIEISEDLLAVRSWKAHCTAITDLTYDIRLFRFELLDSARMNFTAGHYIQLATPPYTAGMEPTMRAFSIASNPRDNRNIDLIIRRVPGGICTHWCFTILKVGDEVQMTGPYGTFHLSDSQCPMIFIAGGSGLAPFVSILHQMKNTHSIRPTTLFFGGNQVRDLYFVERMREFEKTLADFRFVPVVACPASQENWQGQTGLVTDAVRRRGEDLRDYEGYICGSPGMIDASIEALTEMRLPQDKIYYDKFV